MGNTNPLIMDDKFSLSWNDFQHNISKTFGNLRGSAFYHDVTMVGDDHKQISAHKIVLSASSEYFDEILKSNIHPNPMLCFDGIDSKDLNNVLDYMYNGELKIYQKDLKRFMKIAQRFRLEGLLVPQDQEEVKTENFEDKYEEDPKEVDDGKINESL